MQLPQRVCQVVHFVGRLLHLVEVVAVFSRCRLLLAALAYPGGMGMGVDRLVMILTGRGIRETILFPLLKPL